MDETLRKTLMELAVLGSEELYQFIDINNIDITNDDLLEIVYEVAVGSKSGMLFRHNGNMTKKLTKSYNKIPFPIIIREDLDFTYNTRYNNITFNRDGWYKISANITITNERNRRQLSESSIYINDDIQIGSLAVGYHRLRNIGTATIPMQYLCNITKNDVIDIRSRSPRSNNELTTKAAACNLLIESV